MLGKDHRETLATMYDLAAIYNRQGRNAEAEKLYKETLEIRRRVLGQDHPSRLGSVSMLASVYLNQGRYAEAENLCKETLKIQRRVLRHDHPDTVGSMYHLASVAALRGDRKQVLDWLAQAVDHGYKNADGIVNDDDLKSLRGDPAFEKLVDRARENAGKAK